ncbi:MAG: hypothetical protein H7296_03310 [Bacteroidia bacterium]|nr:hypothetical protein [Bacteroidia bacterium]
MFFKRIHSYSHQYLVLFLLSFLYSNVWSQTRNHYEKPITKNKKDNIYILHDGLYVSASTGIIYGNVFDSYKSYDYIYKGASSVFDLKIGGAIIKNLILHATVIGISNNNPVLVDRNKNTQNKMGKNYTFNETMLGVGITYYFMPVNILTSVSLGAGQFVLYNESSGPQAIMSPRSPSLQIKAGKEWLFYKKWSVGAAVIYHHTSTSNLIDEFFEQISSHRYGILLNASFN